MTGAQILPPAPFIHCGAEKKADIAHLLSGRPFPKAMSKPRFLALLLTGLISLDPLLQAASPVPTGGKFTAGSGSFSINGNSLTVNQSTFRSIIDWKTFSILPGALVNFQNGGGATLNRVSGSAVSSILGQLQASGALYLINPQGVLIGKGAVIHTGGDFLASTLNVSNKAFLNSGSLLFSGSSPASVINLGQLTSAGGNIYLIGRSVQNGGVVTAPNGTVGLAAGSQVLLSDGSQHMSVLAPAEMSLTPDSSRPRKPN